MGEEEGAEVAGADVDGLDTVVDGGGETVVTGGGELPPVELQLNGLGPGIV